MGMLTILLLLSAPLVLVTARSMRREGHHSTITGWNDRRDRLGRHDRLNRYNRHYGHNLHDWRDINDWTLLKVDSSNEEKITSWMDPSSDEAPVSQHEWSNEEEYMSHRNDEKRFMEELMSNLPPPYSHEEVEDVDDNDEDDDDDWIASPPLKPLRPSSQPISPVRPIYPQKHMNPQKHDTKYIPPQRPDTKYIPPQRPDTKYNLPQRPDTKYNLPQRPDTKPIFPVRSETKPLPPQRPEHDTKYQSPMKPGNDWSTEEKPISRRDRMNEKKEMSPQNNGKLIIENLLNNLPSESSPKPCPTGWQAHGQKCYVYVPLITTWPDAERNCLILGGNLASVHGPHQYRFLLSVIEKSAKKDQRTWVGANDAIQEGLWLWSDGSRFKYHNWSEGQPSNYKGQEHCMEMNYGEVRGQNDAPCWYEFPFLCSRKL